MGKMHERQRGELGEQRSPWFEKFGGGSARLRRALAAAWGREWRGRVGESEGGVSGVL